MSRENWWMDYIEGDIDESTCAEMKSLLRHSVKDQELVKAIVDTKALLRTHAPPVKTASKERLDFLHDKIMAGIEDAEIKPPPRYRLKAHHHRWVKVASKGLAVLALIASVEQIASSPSGNVQADVSRQMAQQVQDQPDDLAVLMSYQSEHDFYVDVASQSLDQLTKEQLESFLNATVTQ